MSLHFEHELDDLKQKLLSMAGHAEAAVTRAIQALVQRDDNLAARVEDSDSILDQLEMEVDELAVKMLAKAPLATQLRFITVAMKAARDLERVGDEATTIARRARELNGEPQLKPYVDIPRMAELALQMLREGLECFVHRNPAKAREIVPRDKQVDALNKQLYRELVSFMIEDPATVTRSLHLMTIAKCLERIADHATNIAEEVVFLFEGRDIRHAGSAAL